MSIEFVITEKNIVFNGGGKAVMTRENAHPTPSLQHV